MIICTITIAIISTISITIACMIIAIINIIRTLVMITSRIVITVEFLVAFQAPGITPPADEGLANVYVHRHGIEAAQL